MKTPLRTASRRAAAVLAGSAMLAAGLALTTSAPAGAIGPGCTMTFTPDAIGPGQVSQSHLEVNGHLSDYRAVMSFDGTPVGDPATVVNDGGPIPYEQFASVVAAKGASVVLGFQVYWNQPTRRAEPLEPVCSATLTLLAPQTTPAPPASPTTPSTPTTGAQVSLKAPKALPLSAGTAKLTATSTGAGAISLTSASPKVCTVQGTTAKLRRAGLCKIDASQTGAATVRTDIRVWATPAVPRRADTTRVIEVLGRGEGALRVSATPATVCRATDGDVALIDAGTCTITVRDHGDVVRRATVDVALAGSDAVRHGLARAATVYFGFDSAQLTSRGKAALRDQAKRLRDAELVVVYGHTFGPGKNSKHSRALAERRAEAVVRYLDGLGITAKPATVALAMQQPVSKNPAKNRRVEVYYR